MAADRQLTDRARAAVVAMGLPSLVADCIEAEILPGFDGREQCRLSWGHPAMRRGRMGRSEVGASVFPMTLLEERLEDRAAMADMFVAVRRLLPAAVRDAPLPQWAEERGQRIRDALGTAAALSATGLKEAAKAAA